jgi:hypothetical protein
MNKETRNYGSKKFEFLLLINGNIVCQRYFNVREFNHDVLNSYDLKNCVDKCVDLINGESYEYEIAPESTFKGKTWNYLWSGYNPYLEEYPITDVRNVYENEDIFTFQIRINGRPVIEKNFTGNNYPPKVRYDVDIRGVVGKIINQIQETLGEKNLEMVVNN